MGGNNQTSEMWANKSNSKKIAIIRQIEEMKKERKKERKK